ncbi:MAG: serine hydrolase domain-containing protein [Candidatus Thorarchaeota archaeon]|jgi:CubicO group peptidase (beta-lactamase class C family)
MSSSSKGQLVAFIVITIILGTSLVPIASAARDYWPTESWRISTPEEQGMNSTKLEEMVEYLQGPSALRPLSILIVRNGYIVFEEYLSSTYDENRTMDVYSCTLSILSALVGIAIDEGLIESVDANILEFFSDREITVDAEEKAEITIWDLLTMTSGLSWEENSDPTAMKVTNDWIQYVLDRPMLRDPGTYFEYNSGAAHLLSAILQNVTGNTASEMAYEYLFDPIGVEEVVWDTDPQGYSDGTGSCDLTTRDMAKIGYLYLNNGTWDGTQIIPKDWVLDSQQSLVSVNTIKDYGYLWWIYRGVGAYNAVGFWARVISVIPEYDMVAVVTGYDNNGDFLRNQWKYALTEWIIPAAQDVITPAIPVDWLTISAIISAIAAVVLVVVVIIRVKK